ncbi:MAG: tyrosine-type recombinase/integrase [Gemmataceae bacterium]
MPRKPSVRYWPSRKGYCVKVNGVQHLLAPGPDDYGNPEPGSNSQHGPTYLAALDEFKRLMEFGKLDAAGDAKTVCAVLDKYLQSLEGRCRPKTFRIRHAACRLLVERCGEMRVCDVKPLHAQAIIAEQRKPRKSGRREVRWGDGQVRIFVQSIKAAFNWAVEQEIIARNPVRAVKAPPARSMSRERVLTQAEHEQVLGCLTSPQRSYLRRFVVALEATGARPGELANARARDWNDQLEAIVYFKDDVRREDEFAHKTSAKKNRIIRFSGEALAMVRALVKDKRPEDLIFPTQTGGIWECERLAGVFKKIRRRTGLKGVKPYCYRHTFATRWLEQGRSIEMLAELLGNTPRTILAHYNHLCQQHGTLRAALQEFRNT